MGREPACSPTRVAKKRESTTPDGLSDVRLLPPRLDTFDAYVF